ncbi:MAG: hypothetical protein RIR17_1427, partial [Planctomycetota bacterium]
GFGMGFERKASLPSKAKAVIFLHQFGGPSQMDTFDMKPNVPDAYRSPYKPVPSSLAGVPICEMISGMAPMMNKVTIIRSVHHEMKNHNSAGYYSLTGYSPPSDDQRLRDSRDLAPAMGSIVDKLRPGKGPIPNFVSFPHVIRDGSVTPGQHASFLGKSHDPFFIGQDPNSIDFKLPELVLPSSFTSKRLENRKEMMQAIDDTSKLIEKSIRAKGIQENFDRALEMLQSNRLKTAFDLSSEPESVRKKYGRTTYGQSCLLARRLVEAGVSFVNVYFSQSIGGCEGGWDTHGFNNKPMYPIMKNHLLPITNQTLPTLINDLEERGLLESTLVFWAGEFGRTPKINNLSGRDHWPQCYTVLMAGGGIKKGFVFGSSDSKGAFPAQDPVRPEDLSATIYNQLGIKHKTEIKDNLNRPLPISPGKVIQEVIA